VPHQAGKQMYRDCAACKSVNSVLTLGIKNTMIIQKAHSSSESEANVVAFPEGGGTGGARL